MYKYHLNCCAIVVIFTFQFQLLKVYIRKKIFLCIIVYSSFMQLNNLQELTLHPRLSQERCLYIIQKAPRILLIAEKSNILEKIHNLHRIGFNDQQIFELVMKHPALLTYSKTTVNEKVLTSVFYYWNFFFYKDYKTF